MRSVRVFVAGHKGMVGSALVRSLKRKKKLRIITVDKKKLNLINQKMFKHILKGINLIKFIYQLQK